MPPAGPAPELLWPNGAPGALGAADEDKPSITPYLAKSPNGTAVPTKPVLASPFESVFKMAPDRLPTPCVIFQLTATPGAGCPEASLAMTTSGALERNCDWTTWPFPENSDSV